MQIDSKQVIEEVFNGSLSCGIVSNQHDFSKLAGRNIHWYSWLKVNDYPPSTEALLTLANSLSVQADKTRNRIAKSNIKKDIQKLYHCIALKTKASYDAN